ncbi:MAG TPA: ABC transporter permease [Chitinophagaceae bacterium]|nr:ABC transporter permease [Chitinophagaceae bacterium]
MARIFLRTALRRLQNALFYNLLNLAGLTLGLASSLLIWLWVQDERSVDGFHANGRLLFQVFERNFYDGKVDAGYPTQGLLAGELKRQVPEIQYAIGLERASAPGTLNTLGAGDHLRKMKGMFAGDDFFRMFSYPLLEGDVASALSTPRSLVLSRSAATYFFGSPRQALGKTLRFDNTADLLVTAVFEDLPPQSSQQFDFLRNWDDFVSENKWVPNWGNTDPETFVQLIPGADPARVEAKIRDFLDRFLPRDHSFVTQLGLQPYPERYLHGQFRNGQVAGGRILYVRIFTVVALFILLIACINFMNLVTARSSRRGREIGLRKVVGATRGSLIAQFIGEALLMVGAAGLLALILAEAFLPGFNQLTGKQIQLPLDSAAFLARFAGLLLATGLMAGGYPALLLSSFRPIPVLRGNLKFGWSALAFRKGLVVFQFSLALLLMIGMIVTYRQLDYIQQRNLGYNRSDLLYLPQEGSLARQYVLFKQQAGHLPGVAAMSKMRNSPARIEHHTGSISWPGKDPNLTISFADEVVGYDFVRTLGLQIREGRDFSPDYPSDSLGFLVNETAASRMGFNDPVGQTVIWGKHPGRIIGVIRDFNFNSLHQAIEPLIVRLDEQWPWGTILVRTLPGQTPEAIASLGTCWKKLNPGFPFNYQFADAAYGRLYQSDQVVGRLAEYFASLAIFISCLGLLGLATFTAAQRTREIGVRKVLGASPANLIALLSWDFVRLVGLAALIAFPVAGWLLHGWLQQFAYRIRLGWGIFVLAGLAALLLALFTVLYQAMRAALVSPVKSLRTE